MKARAGQHKPIDRISLNAFEDKRVVQWVEQSGKDRLVISGLWTENCLALSALSALDMRFIYLSMRVPATVKTPTTWRWSA
jgi:nicotinamidase-related amidase